MPQSSTVLKLSVGCTNYAWGQLGESSRCAQLGQISIPNLKIDPSKPYAEVSPMFDSSPPHPFSRHEAQTDKLVHATFPDTNTGEFNQPSS